MFTVYSLFFFFFFFFWGGGGGAGVLQQIVVNLPMTPGFQLNYRPLNLGPLFYKPHIH